jgi:nicotinamide-nucleotide adenylyltransferase
VEKTPAKGDASSRQRLEMTLLLGNAITRDQPSIPVAVGITNEATFVKKSSVIHDYLGKTQEHPSSLAFLIGTDTLTRFFDNKFYPPGQMDAALARFFHPRPKGDGSVVVFAQRGGTEQDRNLERDVLAQNDAKKWVELDAVRMSPGLDRGLTDVSSTRVRRATGEKASLQRMLPTEVVEYIMQEGLYGWSGEKR